MAALDTCQERRGEVRRQTSPTPTICVGVQEDIHGYPYLLSPNPLLRSLVVFTNAQSSNQSFIFLQGRGLFQIGLCRANQGCRTRMKSHQFCIIALFYFFIFFIYSIFLLYNCPPCFIFIRLISRIIISILSLHDYIALVNNTCMSGSNNKCMLILNKVDKARFSSCSGKISQSKNRTEQRKASQRHLSVLSAAPFFLRFFAFALSSQHLRINPRHPTVFCSPHVPSSEVSLGSAATRP